MPLVFRCALGGATRWQGTSYGALVVAGKTLRPYKKLTDLHSLLLPLIKMSSAEPGGVTEWLRQPLRKGPGTPPHIRPSGAFCCAEQCPPQQGLAGGVDAEVREEDTAASPLGPVLYMLVPCSVITG